MKHIEGNFKGVRSTNIYYQGWLPQGNVTAVLYSGPQKWDNMLR